MEIEYLYESDIDAEFSRLVDDGEYEAALGYFLRDGIGVSDPEIEYLRDAPNWESRVAEADTLPREYRAPISYVFDPDRFADLATPTFC